MGSPLPAHSFSRFDFFYVTEEKREKMSEAWQKVTEEAKKEVEDAIASAKKRYTMLNIGQAAWPKPSMPSFLMR